MSLVEFDKQGHVAVVTLNRPDARNAINPEVAVRLAEAWQQVKDDDGIRVAVLTGTGSAFCAGADLGQLIPMMSGARQPENEWDERVAGDPGITSRALLRNFDPEKPVIAAINGHAIAGGCILACACDLKVMAEGDGRIGVPELRVGVPFPVAALEILRFAVPRQHLQKLAYVGRTYGPRDALAWGLVDELAAPERLADRTLEAARELAAIPRGSFALSKAHLRRPALERIRAYGSEIDPRVAELWAEDGIHDHVREYLERTIGRSS